MSWKETSTSTSKQWYYNWNFYQSGCVHWCTRNNFLLENCLKIRNECICIPAESVIISHINNRTIKSSSLFYEVFISFNEPTVYKYRELWQQHNVLNELPGPSPYAITNATQRHFESTRYTLVAFISKGISINRVAKTFFINQWLMTN